jgi:hypothetical protein
MKIVIIKPKPRRHPQILEFLQGYVVPPNCSASSRQMIEHIRNNAPRRSMSKILCFTVISLLFRLGDLKKM